MSLGIKSSAFLRVEETGASKFEVQISSVRRTKFMKIMEFDVKRVHMAQYELILKLQGNLWLRITFKPLLTPK